MKTQTDKHGLTRTPPEAARFGVVGWLQHERSLNFLRGLAKLGKAADVELKRRKVQQDKVGA